MNPVSQATSVDIRNADYTQAIVVQVTPFLWTEVAGRRELTATTLLSVHPNVMKIGPGEIRSVILRGSAQSPTPRYHRIRVEQVTTETSEAKQGVQTRFAYNLPVFIDDAGESEAVNVDVSIDTARKTATVSMENEGQRYFLATGFTISHAQLSEGSVVTTSLAGKSFGQHYVLPGQTVAVSLPLEDVSGLENDGSLFNLEILGEQGTPILTELRETATGKVVNPARSRQ